MSGHVRVLDSSTRTDTAHGRAAELVKTQRSLTDRLDAFFREIDEVKALLLDEGSLWSGPVLDPPVEAARSAWLSRGPKEKRVELRTIADPPLMELE